MLPLRVVLVSVVASSTGTCTENPAPAEASVQSAAATPAPPQLQEVTIASKPSGAKVLLQGAELGTTPHVLKFKAATTVTVSAPGYRDAQLTIDGGSEPNEVVVLEPDPAAAAQPEAAPEAEPAASPAPAAKTSTAKPSTSSKKAAPDPAATPTTTATPTSAPAAPSLAYPNVAAARADYQAGKINRDAYDQAVRQLKARRSTKLEALKAKYQAGQIDKDEYNRRKRIIDNEYKGV